MAAARRATNALSYSGALNARVKGLEWQPALALLSTMAAAKWKRMLPATVRQSRRAELKAVHFPAVLNGGSWLCYRTLTSLVIIIKFTAPHYYGYWRSGLWYSFFDYWHISQFRRRL